MIDSPPGFPSGHPQKSMVTRAEIANAAGVTDQAVSNWERRDPDFPAPAWRSGRMLYPVAPIAAWLDARKIPQDKRRPGERVGVTYGERFRRELGLAEPEPRTAARPGDDPPVELDRTLWAPLARHQRDADFSAYQALVMSLVCLAGTDPAAWTRITRTQPPRVTRSGADSVRELVLAAWWAQPAPLKNATVALSEIPATQWWRHRLRQIVEVLDEHLDQPGGQRSGMSPAAAYDYLLDKFAEARHHSPDQFLTPAALARLMARIAGPRPRDRVHDPCCGSGELLTAVMAQLPATSEPARITGRATARRTWQLAAMNVAVHGGRVDLGSGPAEDPREIGAGPGRYDVIVANPPFNLADWRLPAGRRQEQWRYGDPPPHNANFGWLQLAVDALDDGGRAVVLMPGNAAATHNSKEMAIRNAMVDDGVVRCVIAFPEQLFRETTSATTLWVLAPPGAQPREELLLMDAGPATRRQRPTHRRLTGSGCDAIVNAYQGWLAGESRASSVGQEVVAVAVPLAQVRDHGYDLRPATYLRPRPARWESRDTTVRETLNDLRQLREDAESADAALHLTLDRLRLWKL